MRTSDIITERAIAPTQDQFFKGLFICLFALAACFTLAKQAMAQQDFADLVEKVQPAVVNIAVVQKIKVQPRRGFPAVPDDVPFGDMMDKFRNRMQEPEEEQTIERQSAGSGFIIDSSGLVVTNHHVIGNSKDITVVTVDGDEYSAEVIGSDAMTDLALLKIEGKKPFPYVKFGSSEKARIGEWVLAIGNPFGFGSSVSAGIISGRDRESNGPYVNFIQTDTAINQGNSGGPLFNMQGDVIGINSMIITPNGGSVGMGFAIPSDAASRYLQQIRELGRVQRSYLGVTIGNITDEVAEILGLDTDDGVIVETVVDDGPADNAGIQVGDIMLSWGGEAIENSRSLQQLVASTPVGARTPVEIIRDGETMTINVVTKEMSKSEEQEVMTGRSAPNPEEPSDVPSLDVLGGMQITNITGEFRRRYNVQPDVDGVAVMTVERGSEAYRKGVRAGSVIESINLKSVKNVGDLLERVEDSRERGRDKILLRISRNGIANHMTIEIANNNDDEDDS